MPQTDSIKVKLDNETKHLLVAAGIIHSGTGRKVKSSGNISEFIRHCIKYALKSDGTSKLSCVEVQHRYWNFKRLSLEEEREDFNASQNVLIERAAEQESIYKAKSCSLETIKYQEPQLSIYHER